MKYLTVDEVMTFEPCDSYPRLRIEELFAGRDALSLVNILDLDIPAEDRLWALFQNGVLSPEMTQRFCDVVADRAVTTFALRHPSTKQWAERWLSGEDRSAKSAWAAAAWATEAEVVWAAWAAAEAAWAGAAAARAAEDAAEAAAAGAAERKRQVEDLRAILIGEAE